MRARWNSIPSFWKIYIIIVLTVECIVLLIEGVLEPVIDSLFQLPDPNTYPLQGILVWTVSILLLALPFSFMALKLVSVQVKKIEMAGQRFLRGDLAARVDVEKENRSVFTEVANGFNLMAETLEHIIYNERRLLADISHELRSPLTRMSIATALVLRKEQDQASITILHKLEKEVEQMSELVDMLLAHSSGRLTRDEPLDLVDLSAFLENVASEAELRGNDASKIVERDIDPGLRISARPSALRRLFGNVTANALFYTPDNSSVIITAKRHVKLIVVTVRDHGPGVPKNQLEDIFRPFYRVDGSRNRANGGVGLGLALAREAATMCGGRIIAQNAQPGLEIVITLPVYAA